MSMPYYIHPIPSQAQPTDRSPQPPNLAPHPPGSGPFGPRPRVPPAPMPFCNPHVPLNNTQPPTHKSISLPPSRPQAPSPPTYAYPTHFAAPLLLHPCRSVTQLYHPHTQPTDQPTPSAPARHSPPACATPCPHVVPQPTRTNDHIQPPTQNVTYLPPPPARRPLRAPPTRTSAAPQPRLVRCRCRTQRQPTRPGPWGRCRGRRRWCVRGCGRHGVGRV